MRTGSKAELAYLMMFFRVLMLRQHEAFVSEDEEDCLGGDDVDSGSDSDSDCEIDGEAGTANDGRDEDADDAADEEQWRQEGPWVGYSVRRFFQGVVVDGKTIGWLEADEEQGDGMCHADQTTTKTPTPSHRHPWPMIHAVDALWRIEHHDGDKEDLEEDELFIALYAHEHQSEVEPELEDAQEWAFERREGVEEGGEAEGEEGEEGEEGDNEGDGQGEEEGGGDDSTIRDALDKFVPFILKCRQESASSAQLQQLTRDGKLMMRDLKQAFGASRPGELCQLSTRLCNTSTSSHLCTQRAPAACTPEPLLARLLAAKPLWHKLRHVADNWRWLGAIFFEQNEEHGEREHAQAHAAFDTTNSRPADLLDQMANHLEHHLALRTLLRQKALVEQLLCWLVLNGRTCDAKWLIESRGASPDAKDSDGDPALVIAAGDGQLGALRLLIKLGANLEARDHEQVLTLSVSFRRRSHPATEYSTTRMPTERTPQNEPCPLSFADHATRACLHQRPHRLRTRVIGGRRQRALKVSASEPYTMGQRALGSGMRAGLHRRGWGFARHPSWLWHQESATPNQPLASTASQDITTPQEGGIHQGSKE